MSMAVRFPPDAGRLRPLRRCRTKRLADEIVGLTGLGRCRRPQSDRHAPGLRSAFHPTLAVTLTVRPEFRRPCSPTSAPKAASVDLLSSEGCVRSVGSPPVPVASPGATVVICDYTSRRVAGDNAGVSAADGSRSFSAAERIPVGVSFVTKVRAVKINFAK